MPLDAADRPSGHRPPELYLERRRRAAALWATVPERAFRADHWLDLESPGGATACAVGWLALLRHDGWCVVAGLPYHPESADVGDVYARAARYLGLSWFDALVIFGPSAWRSSSGPSSRPATLAEVAAAVLAAPVVGRGLEVDVAVPAVTP